MKRLKVGMKAVLNGLAHQNAGDFLSKRHKSTLLGGDPTHAAPPSPTVPLAPGRRPSRRVALVSDGRGAGAPLDYAIESCERQQAEIDLLVHGHGDLTDVDTIEERISEAGVPFRRIQLDSHALNALTDYILTNRSLSLLIAMPDDMLAKRIVEEVIPGRGSRLPVPLVLIEDRSKASPSGLSAA